MITALIVEDDMLHGDQLRLMIRELQPDVNFIMCTTGEEALHYLENKENKVDIFFLDRELPGVDGFTIASIIREKKEYFFTPIVFVTGFEMDQLNAFSEYHCYSYILKPLSKEIVAKQIKKLLVNLGNEKRQALHRALLLIEREGESIVLLKDVLYLERLGRDCRIYTTSKSLLIPRKSIDKQLEDIGEPFVVRCHKSFGVNLANVVKFEKVNRNIWVPVFKNGILLGCEISKAYHDIIVKNYQEFLAHGK